VRNAPCKGGAPEEITTKSLAGDGGESTREPRPDQARRISPQARWRQRNPLARWAHVALASALKRGLVARLPCEVCGDPKTDGHHPDYSRPMDVVWLCRRHHKAAHAKSRNGGGGRAS